MVDSAYVQYVDLEEIQSEIVVQSDVPIGTDSGFLFFLHDFGELFVEMNPVQELFSLDINGYSFLATLVGSGFIVYCGWVLLKWIIP